jgi:hypothetical protein
VVCLYLYGLITVSKFQFYLRRLEAAHVVPRTRDLNDDDEEIMGPWAYAVLWPLAVGFESEQVKGLLYPTLWLWPTFREEWPVLKAERRADRGFESHMKRNSRQRERYEKRGDARLEDVKEELRHNKRMARINTDVDAVQELLINDHPPALEEGKSYVKGTELDTAGKEVVPVVDGDQWCVTHAHWVKPNGRDHTSNCKF